jgi:integrase
VVGNDDIRHACCDAYIGARFVYRDDKKQLVDTYMDHGVDLLSLARISASSVEEIDACAELLRWIRYSQPETTRSGYATYLKQWRDWCVANHRDPFPASPESVALFLKYLSEERGLSRNTINSSAVAAIASEYKLVNWLSPTTSPLVHMTKDTIARKTPATRHRKPLSLGQLQAAVNIAEDDITRLINAYDANMHVRMNDVDYDKYRDHFIMILMWAASMRPSEASMMRWKHLTLTTGDGGRKILNIFIPRTKNDQYNEGHTRYVPEQPGHVACPVRWYELWRALAIARRLWHGVNDYVFHLKTGRPMATGTINNHIKAMLARIGVTDVTAGGMRAGGTTAAANAGIEQRLLARHGNWRSDAILSYINDSIERKASVVDAMYTPVSKATDAAADGGVAVLSTPAVCSGGSVPLTSILPTTE